jgi:sortase A
MAWLASLLSPTSLAPSLAQTAREGRGHHRLLIGNGSGLPTGLVRARALNILSLLFLVGAMILLGKSCWITLKAEVAQVLLDRAFSQSISSGATIKPWSWADTWPVAEVKVARLGAAAVVLHGATGEALAFGPTWLPDTARPGERGTAVLAAHRDTHFAFLKDVRKGDKIAITRTDGLTFEYKVTGMRVTQWNKSGIDRLARGHHLVLSTCWPFDGITRGDDRYLVEAEMIN